MDEYYKILNINSNYSIENIKKAYRKLSLKYHPDKNNNNSEYFNKINNAYNYIINNSNNSNNSNNNGNNNSNNNGNNNSNNGNNNSNNGNNNSNNGNNGNNGNNNSNNSNNGNNDNNGNINHSLLPINNYENNILNNNTSHFHHDTLEYSYKEDIIKELNISFEESYSGSIKPLNIQRQIINNNIIKYENETIYINIPRGIDNEELIVINNKGNVFNGNYSNVKIIIKLLKHPDFYREGLDIYYNTSITFKESLVGFNFILKHLNNKNYKIENKINTIVHNNSKIILKNLGFNRNEFIGNLYITFSINYPKLFDSDTIQKLKEIL